MGKILALLFLMCIQASAGLILVITDPDQVVAPGADAVFHGNLTNTDPVGYNVVSFVMLNPPTDAVTPPTLAELFPFSEPAVPFQITAGGQFNGILVDITVPLTAQSRSHPFAIEAATDVLGTDGNTIVSNNALADLSVSPEPGTIGLVGACMAGLYLVRRRRARSGQARRIT